MEELATVVSRARTGDRDAYRAVVERLQDMAVAYAYGILGDFHLAEDAAQEAFIEAYFHLHQLQESGAFPGWLRKIVFKHCDRLTRGKRVPQTRLDAAAEVVVTGAGPEELTLRSELRADVLNMVDDLPDSQRTLVALYHMGDYTCGEIAAFLGVPVTTVKNRLHAARSALRAPARAALREHLREHRPSETERFVERIQEMITIAPDRREHEGMVLGIVGAQWPSVSDAINWGRITDSHYDWATSRIGIVDGVSVTHFGVYDLTMRVGVARLRTAGVQLVTTRANHRGHSLMAETAPTAIAAMQANGYSLSVVCHADPAGDTLYGRLGYVQAWPETSFSVRVEDLPTGPLGMHLHEYIPGRQPDLAAALAEVYNRDNERVTGTAVRPTFLRTKMPDDGDLGWRWEDEAGRVLGYVHGARTEHPQPGTFWHVDSAGDPSTRLQVLRSLAERYGCTSVFFDRQPVRGPLGRALRRVGCVQRVQHRAAGGWLIRVVDLRSAMEQLVPELAGRLANSGMSAWAGDLVISIGEDPVTLRIDGTSVAVVADGDSAHAIRGGQEIAQLLVGTRDPDETAESAGLQLSGDARRLMRSLFPAQDPQMCNEDL